MTKTFASQADMADKVITFERLSANAYAYTAHDPTRYFWSMFNVQKRDRRRGRWRSRDTRPRRSYVSF